MSLDAVNTQTSILERALGTACPSIPTDAAEYLLSIGLDPMDARRADELAAKAREGSLTSDEEAEIDEYRRVGRVIEMLRLRARAAMKQAG